MIIRAFKEWHVSAVWLSAYKVYLPTSLRAYGADLEIDVNMRFPFE
jgi:hypothetical protein